MGMFRTKRSAPVVLVLWILAKEHTHLSLLKWICKITSGTGELVTLPRPHQNFNYPTMPQCNNTRESLNEDQIQLAIKAIQQDATLTHRRAVATYNVSQRTLSSRLARTRPRRNCKPKSIKLLLIEEETIV